MPLQPDEVLTLFSQYQRRLYLYILSSLPNPADAEDVLQNTNIVVWQKFDQFKPDTDFRAWVFRIAYYEICKLRDRNRQLGLSFSPELLGELAVEYQRHEDVLELRRAATPGCVEQLSTPDRNLLDAVYGRRIGVSELASQMQREATSIYRSLRRIRQWLYECIERSVRKETQS
jgi:RNA polymerase sigma-70 factor, ECF subfamily